MNALVSFELTSRLQSKIVPTDKDVLTTTKATAGRRFDFHPGNKNYDACIEANKDSYKDPSATRTIKSTIIESIVRSIHETSGRFLCLNESTGEWFVLSSRRVADKVSHALRLRCRKRQLSRTSKNNVVRKRKMKVSTFDEEVKKSAFEFFRALKTSPHSHEDASRDEGAFSSPPPLHMSHISLEESATGIDGEKDTLGEIDASTPDLHLTLSHQCDDGCGKAKATTVEYVEAGVGSAPLHHNVKNTESDTMMSPSFCSSLKASQEKEEFLDDGSDSMVEFLLPFASLPENEFLDCDLADEVLKLLPTL